MQHDASDRRSGTGRLIFLVGPSGSGKDSLIDASRERLAAAGVEVARRVITRSAEAKGEAAQGVTAEQFETCVSRGICHVLVGQWPGVWHSSAGG